jgi:hypothetical protein
VENATNTKQSVLPAEGPDRGMNADLTAKKREKKDQKEIPVKTGKRKDEAASVMTGQSALVFRRAVKEKKNRDGRSEKARRASADLQHDILSVRVTESVLPAGSFGGKNRGTVESAVLRTMKSGTQRQGA